MCQQLVGDGLDECIGGQLLIALTPAVLELSLAAAQVEEELTGAADGRASGEMPGWLRRAAEQLLLSQHQPGGGREFDGIRLVQGAAAGADQRLGQPVQGRVLACCEPYVEVARSVVEPCSAAGYRELYRIRAISRMFLMGDHNMKITNGIGNACQNQDKLDALVQLFTTGAWLPPFLVPAAITST